MEQTRAASAATAAEGLSGSRDVVVIVAIPLAQDLARAAAAAVVPRDTSKDAEDATHIADHSHPVIQQVVAYIRAKIRLTEWDASEDLLLFFDSPEWHQLSPTNQRSIAMVFSSHGYAASVVKNVMQPTVYNQKQVQFKLRLNIPASTTSPQNQ